jgi:uncharacterized protein (DUF2147 family)
MRLAILSAGTAALLASAAAGQGSAGAITGNWRTDDGRAVITVAPCSAGAATMCGRISRFLVPEPTGGARDGNNPNRALRNRSLMGVAVLTNLSFRDGAWRGSGYSPEEGRNFNATVRTENGRLNVRGCVAVFCRTVVWARSR